MTPVVLVGGVLVVVVLVFLIAGGGGGGDDAAAAAGGVPAAASRTADAGTPRAGKTPTRAAPEISDAAWATADGHYDKARELWTAAQLLRNQGETSRYGATLREAWSELEKLREEMAPYTGWFEEADLEGWAMPAAYGRLQQRLNQWDPLRQKVHKLMPSGR